MEFFDLSRYYTIDVPRVLKFVELKKNTACFNDSGFKAD